MKPKSPEQISLERAVKKERKRVQQFVSRARKRGYTFSENAVPKLPKTITEATLSRFQKLTPKYLYSKAVYTSPTGTKVSGTERRTQERKISAQKAAETRKRYYSTQEIDEYWAEPSWTPADEMSHIIQVLVEDFETWTPESRWSDELQQLKGRDVERGRGIITGLINEYGGSAIAENARANATAINELVNKILYESGNKYRDDARNGEINIALNKLAELLKGGALTRQESMRFTAEGEQNESYVNPS